MGSNFKDTNKALTRGLFMLGADKLEHRFVADPKALRDLFVEMMRISVPAVGFSPDKVQRGTVNCSFEGLDTEVKSIKISIENLFQTLDANDPVRSRAAIVAFAMEIVDKMKSTMTADPKAHLKGPLVTVVGPAKMVQDLNRQLAPSTLVDWQISEDLHAIVAVDGKGGVAYLQHADLATLGLSEEQVREKALANMLRKMRKTRVKFEQGTNGILMATGFEGWTQSLLSLDEFTQALRHRIGGDVVMHVDNDLVFAVEKGNGEGLAAVVNFVDRGIVGSLCPGSFFLVEDEGLSTLKRADIVEMAMSADPSARGPVEKPTLN